MRCRINACMLKVCALTYVKVFVSQVFVVDKIVAIFAHEFHNSRFHRLTRVRIYCCHDCIAVIDEKIAAEEDDLVLLTNENNILKMVNSYNICLCTHGLVYLCAIF